MSAPVKVAMMTWVRVLCCRRKQTGRNNHRALIAPWVLDPEGAAMLDHTSKITPVALAGFVPAFEAQLRQDLRNYAVELRQLAYTLPNGVGEHGLLQLSDRMHAAADEVVRKGA